MRANVKNWFTNNSSVLNTAFGPTKNKLLLVQVLRHKSLLDLEDHKRRVKFLQDPDGSAGRFLFYDARR